MADLPLAAIWREACRHNDLDLALANVCRLLEPMLGHVVLEVYRVGLPPLPLEKVATTRPRGSEAWRDAGAIAASAALLDWIGDQDVVGDEPGALPVLAPVFAVSRARFVGGLLGAQGTHGLLVVLGGVVTVDAADLVPLLEPLASALETHQRLHELMALREAADVERERLRERLGQDGGSGEVVVGAEAGLADVMARVQQVRGADLPVLLLGETGSGKEVVAREIHGGSPRAHGPFIRVNCGAIPEELIDSELFGHERGSFTGATARRRGWFERADGGTLFLDEIGELPAAAQVRLLRVLQDGVFTRVGGETPVHVNVRVVAATHRDLPTMVQEGRFRADLWYRVAVFPIVIPPLRERQADIPALAAHFTRRAAAHFGLRQCQPTARDLALLTAYPWPGNIREFAAVIDRATILGNGERLEIELALGFAAPRLVATSPADAIVEAVESVALPPAAAATGAAAAGSLDDAVRAHIERALARCHGRIEGRHGVAALLDVNPHTLRARMRKLGIDWRRFRGRD